ncbi:MAG: glycosyltransferase 4 family protein [Candidatus Bathyarchaeia archaeon]
MQGVYEYLKYIIVPTIGFLVSFITLPALMKKMKSLGIVGVDVHKKDKPTIPEMGGIGVLTGLSVGIIAALFLFPDKALGLISFLATTLIAGLIGAVDDLKPLNPKVKPFLTLFASLPILIFGTYDPRMALPIVGRTRLTIVYPIMIPVAIAVTSNAVNMMDPFNGTMSGTCSIITIVLLISAIVLNRNEAVLISSALLAALLAFYHFNKYPAKLFSGDVGSLSVGAAIGAIAIIGRLETIAVVAFMPQIMNAFYGLSTIGRLYERREVSRPVHILEDGRLAASDDEEAPITLARMTLARGPLTEQEAIRLFFALSGISGALALFTMYLLMVTT